VVAPGTRAMQLNRTGHWDQAAELAQRFLAETTLRDFARLGLLMLNRGIWEGQRVDSEAWVDQSTEPSQEFKRQYCLLWWLI